MCSRAKLSGSWVITCIHTNGSGEVQSAIDPSVHGYFAASLFNTRQLQLILGLMVIRHVHRFPCGKARSCCATATEHKFQTKSSSEHLSYQKSHTFRCFIREQQLFVADTKQNMGSLPRSETTQRESPALATISCLPRIRATTAVVPLSEPGCNPAPPKTQEPGYTLKDAY